MKLYDIYWSSNNISSLLSLDCISDALNSLFAILHYAYWCVMNRSELRWLTKHIKSHLMSADCRVKSRCHFKFILGLTFPTVQ